MCSIENVWDPQLKRNVFHSNSSNVNHNSLLFQALSDTMHHSRNNYSTQILMIFIHFYFSYIHRTRNKWGHALLISFPNIAQWIQVISRLKYIIPLVENVMYAQISHASVFIIPWFYFWYIPYTLLQAMTF